MIRQNIDHRQQTRSDRMPLPADYQAFLALAPEAIPRAAAEISAAAVLAPRI